MNPRLSVLVIDDDKNICKTLNAGLEELNCTVECAQTLEEAALALNRYTFDIILTDFRLSEKVTALDVIQLAKREQPKSLIIVMTAFSSIENAVAVVKEGAFDYLTKPFSNAQLSIVLKKVRHLVVLARENQELKADRVKLDFFSGFSSPASKRLEKFVTQVAKSEGTILISGETGTGKSELAKLIHELSDRAEQPFITVYCTTLTESLIESELFGHVKGAFTGAFKDKVGKLEAARGGTLFLDEIGELPPASQAKLLRFLHEKIFEPVGSNREVTVDARVLAATNKNLAQEVAKGRFREDLFYRINAIECEISPLRERKDDLKVLIDKISSEILGRIDLNRHPLWSEEIMQKLISYSWPGNVRELRNALERIFTLSKGRQPILDDLPISLLKINELSENEIEENSSLAAVEKQYIGRVLAKEKNLERAAGILGITSVTLWRKRKEYGLE